MNLDALSKPASNGYTTGGLYVEDRPGDLRASYCQITGKECAVFDDGARPDEWDCRECNIPVVAALCRLSRTIGAKGVE